MMACTRAMRCMWWQLNASHSMPLISCFASSAEPLQCAALSAFGTEHELHKMSWWFFSRALHLRAHICLVGHLKSTRKDQRNERNPDLNEQTSDEHKVLSVEHSALYKHGLCKYAYASGIYLCAHCPVLQPNMCMCVWCALIARRRTTIMNAWPGNLRICFICSTTTAMMHDV